MIDNIYTTQLVLQPDVEQEYNFPGISKVVFLENKGFEPISVYYKDDDGYNPEPVVINRKQNQMLKARASGVKVKAKSKTYLEVLTVIGDAEETKGGFYVIFDNTSANPLILKSLVIGNFIRNICISIVEPFDVGFKMEVGFPIDINELVESTEVDCSRVALYEFYPFRVSSSSETLQITFTGASASGKGIIFIEE